MEGEGPKIPEARLLEGSSPWALRSPGILLGVTLEGTTVIQGLKSPASSRV